jgi:hypothetical protein
VMAWFIVVPLAADVVLGVQPTKITDFVRICTGGGGYGRAAAYQGTGPHSTVIYETIEGTTDGYTDYPDYSETGSKNFNDYPRPQAVQLVACSRVIGHASQTPLYQCQYQGGYTEVTFQGRWQVDVYTAQTGRKVASYVVDGSTAESDSTSPCMNFAYARADAPNELDLDTSPEGRGYEAAFAPLVNAVAHH